jgi:hypothetical protein
VRCFAWAIVPSGAVSSPAADADRRPSATGARAAARAGRAPVAPPSVTAAPLARLATFPIIRVVGRATKRGTMITLLTVRAAVGSYVVSRCAGTAKRCPSAQRMSRIPGKRGRTRTTHVQPFERCFRAAVLLRVYVVNPGRIGRFTSYKIRRGRRPRRHGGCIAGHALRPVSCSRG